MQYTTDYPSCYLDFITLKNCTSGSSKSGLYVEQLEGLSSKATAQIAGPAQNTAKDLVHESLMTVLGMYELKIQAYMQSLGYFMPPLPLKFREFGNFQSSQTKGNSPIERGLKISRFGNIQPFAGLYIHALTLRTKHTGPANVLFRDSQGNLVYTLPVTLDGTRAIEVPVQKLFSQDVLFVVMDNSIIDPFSNIVCLSYDCCNLANQTLPIAPKGYWVQGWDGTTTTGDGYGIGLKIGLGCDIKKLMCYALPYLKYPILYSLGIQILNHLQASERINYFSVASKEWASEKAQEWETKAQMLWQQAVKTLMPSLFTLDEVCLQCDKANKPNLYSTV